MWNFDLPEIRSSRHCGTRLAEILDDAVDQLAVADLVLDLRGQGELALQRGRAQDPVALREHAHQLRIAVHLDELDQPGAVLVGHPIVGLDEAAALDVLEKCLLTGFHGRASLPNGR